MSKILCGREKKLPQRVEGPAPHRLDLDQKPDRGRYSSTHSRHSRYRAEITAGPRNSPIRPQLSTPPRMPSRTQMKGSLVVPPIRAGRMKWSATKVTTTPDANTVTAQADRK